MKNLSKKLLSLFIAVMLLMFSVPFAFAEDKNADAGSTVEYTLSIADSQQKITGIHFELYFNKDVLKVKDVNTDNLSGSTVNADENNTGRITVVNGLINGSRGLVCKDKTALITVTFEVLKAGNAEVSYYIPYMYDYDMVNIHTYTLTEDMSIDGTTVSENAVPVLADVKELEKSIPGFDRGDFKNTADGKGGSSASTEPATETATQNSEEPSSVNVSDNAEKKILEYKFSVADATQALSNFRIIYLYNVNALKLMDVEIVNYSMDNTSINYDKAGTGKIVVSKGFGDKEEPPVLKDRTEIVKLTFEVIGEGNYDIRYFITEMKDTEDVSLYKYTLTETTILDGQIISENKTPVLANINEIQSDGNDITFENRSDGKGSGIKPTKPAGESGSEPATNSGLIIGVACGGIIIVAVVLLIVFKSKGDKDNDEE
ncbi:MAG: hypothetical protein E7566_07620 [Ruminococcaceae bacterium]|nr:hypothetical protein [Oscillospiraceae bacterium]